MEMRINLSSVFVAANILVIMTLIPSSNNPSFPVKAIIIHKNIMV